MERQVFDLAEYEKYCQENLAKFVALDAQISAARTAEERLMADLTPEQKLAYLVQRDADLNQAEDKFKQVVQVTAQESGV